MLLQANRLRWVLFLAALWAGFFSAARGQQITADLSGRVLDESGSVVVGADVTLVNEETGAVWAGMR